MRDLAFHAIQLPLYEGIKDAWLANVQSVSGETRRDLQPLESMICGAMAGMTAHLHTLLLFTRCLPPSPAPLHTLLAGLANVLRSFKSNSACFSASARTCLPMALRL